MINSYSYTMHPSVVALHTYSRICDSLTTRLNRLLWLEFFGWYPSFWKSLLLSNTIFPWRLFSSTKISEDDEQSTNSLRSWDSYHKKKHFSIDLEQKKNHPNKNEHLTNTCTFSLKPCNCFSQTMPIILPKEVFFAPRLNWTRSPTSYRTPVLFLIEETMHALLIVGSRDIAYRASLKGKRFRWMIDWCAHARSKRGTSSSMRCLSFDT